MASNNKWKFSTPVKFFYTSSYPLESPPNLEDSSESSLTKPPAGSPRTGIEGFSTKMKQFTCFHHLCEQVEKEDKEKE